MSSRDDYLWRDLYGGSQDYHQDYAGDSQSWSKYTSIIIPAIVFLLGLIYSGLYALDYNLLSLQELLWNCVVYITPSRLLDLFDSDVKLSKMTNSSSGNIPRTHAAKSDAMRRILGFDERGGIMGTVAQAGRRRFSSISGINMSFRGDDGSPAGLGNWDNSCYQNSVLQGLASLDSFSDYLTDPAQSKESSDYIENPDMKMADSLRGLIAKLKDPSNNGKRIWTPATLKSMSSWQQQDAQEYFSKVLDEIDKEVAGAAKSLTPSQSLPIEQSSKEFLVKGSVLGRLDPAPTSSIRNPLEGLLAQRVGCTRCGYSEGLSMIPFNCLTVPLGKSWFYNLSDCFDEYTKLETIDGVECGRCTLLKTQRLLSIIVERIKDSPDDNPIRDSTLKRLQTVTEALEEDDYEEKTLTQKCNLPPKNRVNTTKSRQAVIARPPQSLAVHVNRSLFDERTGELKKNYAEVRFPKALDLGPWCLGSTGRIDDIQCEEWLLDPAQSMIAGSGIASRIHGPMYELRAVVTHYGRHENGHYICYRKHPVISNSDEEDSSHEQWWRLSDDDVMKVTEENVLGQGGVFMLFYDCIGYASLAHSKASHREGAAAAETISEVVFAAGIPLPTESDDELNASDTDDQSLSQLSREQSITTTISEFGDESAGEEEYHPTKAIYIPPRIHSSVPYHEDEQQGKGLQSPNHMVMV